jgi:hypothetical protein
MNANEEWVEIYRSSNIAKIDLVKSILEGDGIPCMTFDENTATWSPWMGFQARLMVSISNKQRAKELIEGMI